MKQLPQPHKILAWIGTLSMIGGALLVTNTLINEYSHWRGVGLTLTILGAIAIMFGTMLRIIGPWLDIYLAGYADGRADQSGRTPFRKSSRPHHQE